MVGGKLNGHARSKRCLRNLLNVLFLKTAAEQVHVLRPRIESCCDTVRSAQCHDSSGVVLGETDKFPDTSNERQRCVKTMECGRKT
ncbi:hypothetical protein BaRGS_00010163 [Batillaria attramentaria]|uniref:Secreted protein n=1 Tax=Batillaria attramentaria TaxID=370345 RepID=A0ABD0LGJ4_9CAEN